MIKQNSIFKLEKIIQKHRYSNLEKLLNDLVKRIKENTRQKINFDIEFINENENNSCKCDLAAEDTENLKCYIKARNDEIIIAHEVAHQYCLAYDYPDFINDEFSSKFIKLASLFSSNNDSVNGKFQLFLYGGNNNKDNNIRTIIYNFGQHFMVKNELEKYYNKVEVEKRWISKNGQWRDLFKTGNFNKSGSTYQERCNNEKVLNPLVRIKKALTAADLYYALSEKNRSLFQDRFNSNNDEETKKFFYQVKKVIDNIGIENLKNSKNNVLKLYKNIIDLTEKNIS